MLRYTRWRKGRTPSKYTELELIEKSIGENKEYAFGVFVYFEMEI